MTKYILAGGYIHKADDGGRSFCEELVKNFDFNKKVIILDCMFARPKDMWDKKLEEDREFLSKYIIQFILYFGLLLLSAGIILPMLISKKIFNKKTIVFAILSLSTIFFT